MGVDIHLGTPGIISYPDSQTPLGSRIYGGHLRGVGGTGFQQFRAYGMYALVLLLDGTEGRFRDKLGTNRRVGAGDLLVVFPDIPHQYGPEPGDHWEEVFVAFDGAVFETWSAHGLDPQHPVWSLGDPAGWSKRFFDLLKPAGSPAELCHIVAGIHTLIADALAVRRLEDSPPPWLRSACQALAAGAGAPELQQVARDAGMGYDNFRKSFRKNIGESPQRYRSRMRIAHASLMLQRTDLSMESIALSLGYCDGFHFSKAFKRERGCSPSEYRRRLAKPG